MKLAHAHVLWRRFTLATLLLMLLLTPVSGARAARLPGIHPQQKIVQDRARQQAQDLFLKMTPEERVGQLFVVSFPGADLSDTSSIRSLISSYHIGGLILTRDNDNLLPVEDQPFKQSTYDFIAALQTLKYLSTQSLSVNPISGVSFNAQYVPLLIGISQDGNGAPEDQILNGLTPLPSPMTISATWDSDAARSVGEILGAELSAVGVNLYLGPSLDVLDEGSLTSEFDLGTRSFGGNPYWVSEMGQAYIDGLHSGSNNHMAVIARQFPGVGSADRSVDEEVATIRKSLEEMRQTDLAPFFAVTGRALINSAAADGLMVAHARYQGLQGNIRPSTSPISWDKTALDLLLKQPELVDWWQNGGVILSDDLAAVSAQRFFQSLGSAYDPRQVARESFYAGNDLLYFNIARLASQQQPDPFEVVTQTLKFFNQKYRTDPEFARRVDVAVQRILTLKFRLYPQFDLENVIPDVQRLESVGDNPQADQTVLDIARQSVALISPSAAELSSILPQPPGLRSRIVFLTDLQPVQQCDKCELDSPIAIDALQNAVLRLYGSRATGQVTQNLLSSYSFYDLHKLLNNIEPTSTLQDDLPLAEWVVVAMLKPNPALPESQAFQQLLATRPELLRDKKVIVFAFDVPYFLDATNISKLTAYYGIFSKSNLFVDVAARLLFQEIDPSGTLPVSVSGIGYDLGRVTSPDPAQNIPLYIDNPVALQTPLPNPVATLEPTTQAFGVRDVIPLRTGQILDFNGHPVPDGTQVSFLISVITLEGTYYQQIDQMTQDGVARVGYLIEQAGVIDIQASSSGARSDIVRLDVRSGDSAPTIVAQPTITPTLTPTFTPTETSTPTLTVTPTVIVVPTAQVEFRDWLLMIVSLAALCLLALWVGLQRALPRWGVRWALCSVIGGLLAYIYLALDLPGTQQLLLDLGLRATLFLSLGGGLIGLLIGLAWMLFTPNWKQKDRHPTGDRRTPTRKAS